MDHVFIADVVQLHAMLQWIVDCIKPMGFDESTIRKIELASEEAIVNIIRHAYQNRPEEILIDVQMFPKSRVEISFTDHGPPFDPLQQKTPDCSLGLAERAVGGLGIHLMRKNTDEIRYLRKDEKNTLVLVVFFK